MPDPHARIQGERGLSAASRGSSSGSSQRCGLKVVEHVVDMLQRLSKILRPGPVTDTQKLIHPKMVARDYEHALLLQKPFHQLDGVDGKVVARICDRSGARLDHLEGRAMAAHPFLEHGEVASADAARASLAAGSPFRREGDTGQRVA